MDVWGRIFMGLSWGLTASLWNRLRRVLEPPVDGSSEASVSHGRELLAVPMPPAHPFASCGPDGHTFCGAARCAGLPLVCLPPSEASPLHLRRRVIDFDPHRYPDGPMQVERYPESLRGDWSAGGAW